MALYLQHHFFGFLFILFTILTATLASRPCKERIKTFNPEGLLDSSSFGFSQITVDRKNSVAYIAGQAALSRKGEVEGETLREQYEFTVNNVLIAMRAVGADTEDILKLNAYIVNYDPQKDIRLVAEFGKKLGSPASTVVGTRVLAVKGLLVEVEVIVAVSTEFTKSLPC